MEETRATSRILFCSIRCWKVKHRKTVGFLKKKHFFIFSIAFFLFVCFFSVFQFFSFHSHSLAGVPTVFLDLLQFLLLSFVVALFPRQFFCIKAYPFPSELLIYLQ